MDELKEAIASVSADGRVLIPAGYRKALGLRPGDEVVLRLEESCLILYTRELARARAQDYLCTLAPPDLRLSDDLIRERKEEVSRE